MIVDIIIIAIILLSVFLGYRKGLVKLRNRTICIYYSNCYHIYII